MKKILVIEDTAEVRENICEILSLDNYEVISAENGKIGIELAVNEEPDLILCDVMMPELDGFGVLKILNRNPKTFKTPFIFLTAKAEKTDFRKGMGLGADDYITKPFDDTDLLEAIEMRLKKTEHIQRDFEGTDDALQRFFSEAKAKEELDRLTLDREIRNYKAKDSVFSEGSQSRWLYFILEGKVKCYQANEFGKELITHIYKQGEFFGFFPILKNGIYEESAVALEDLKVRLIPPEDFKLILFNNRDFAAKFISMISNQASETEKQLIEYAYSSVRRKVANALLSFADQIEDEGGLKFVASRDDLSAKAGTAKETLIRTLSDFKSEGILEIEGSQIIIKNTEALENMPQ